MGIRVAISTDAHHIDQLWMMELGVRTARRGWLRRENVLNALTTKQLLKAVGSA
jgi:DNA polymerase (family 10)